LDKFCFGIFATVIYYWPWAVVTIFLLLHYVCLTGTLFTCVQHLLNYCLLNLSCYSTFFFYWAQISLREEVIEWHDWYILVFGHPIHLRSTEPYSWIRDGQVLCLCYIYIKYMGCNYHMDQLLWTLQVLLNSATQRPKGGRGVTFVIHMRDKSPT
jgi:hypothetical protein